MVKKEKQRSMGQKMQSDSIESIKKITWTGIVINIFLSGLKFIVGYLGSSQAVIADAVHSLSDLTTDLAVILGVKYWSAPPDENHHYGHGRIEALITAAIGLVLAVVALLLAYESLATLREVHIKQTTWVAITGPALSIIFKEILYRWTIIVGTKAKSTAVIANAWHHRSDAFSSIPALIAVGASSINPDWAYIDHIGALIISGFILKVSWDIVIPALSELTDSGASTKDHESIRIAAMEVAGVRSVHAIRTRKFGSNLQVDLHVLVDPDISVRSGHDISEEVIDRLLRNGTGILDVVTHLEPDE